VNLNATLFVQFVVFFILVFVTMKFVWPPVMKALDERAQRIANGLAAADRGKAEMAAAEKRIAAELAATRDESAKRIADAEKRAAAIIEDAKQTAAVEAARIVEGAEQQVTRAREELRAQVAALAVAGAEQILKREVNAAAHADLLNRLSTEL